ncbi:alpha/beta hydrolase family protein [Actinoplanes sp. RD1]|uniref:alpha/beta hydrolase family protein n=1 Tax=Actinoplanes sp. RD1 TaxID=3064538 RepID=UPI0027408850|nr:alpha/beta hydrolase [Actinoplanes sp. RD1]
MDVLVVLGPGLTADAALLTGQAETSAAALGVGVRVVRSDSTTATRAALAGHDGPSVVTPADRALMTNSATTVWYDLGATDPEPGVPHLQGRGVWGLDWAIRHAVHRLRHPVTERVAYGEHPEQWAELRAAGVDAPVAVLVHGGFWRSVWAADLMDALAIDLADRGWHAWNLEYRRPDRHGWPATIADVTAGVAAIQARHTGPVVVFGHSAGGQLALNLAADVPGLTLAVSLAGVIDLAEGFRRGLGGGAIRVALGGTPEELPEVYAAADPMARIPLKTPVLLVQGAGDDPDLVDANRVYAAASGARLLERPGDHFDVIAPQSAIWRATMAEVDQLLAR